MRVYYTKEVQLYFAALIDLLYEKNYFGFRDNAKEYVNTLTQEIESTLYLKRKERAPSYFNKYKPGLWYAFYPKNKHTTWYVFFTTHPNHTYVIHYITNNHVEGQYII